VRIFRIQIDPSGLAQLVYCGNFANPINLSFAIFILMVTLNNFLSSKLTLKGVDINLQRTVSWQTLIEASLQVIFENKP